MRDPVQGRSTVWSMVIDIYHNVIYICDKPLHLQWLTHRLPAVRVAMENRSRR